MHTISNIHTHTVLPLPELLAPAGNMEKFRTALLYGASAVYLGGTALNLRAAANGFTMAELQEAVTLANASNAKVYYTLNAMPMQEQLAALPGVIEQAAHAGVHAFIIADPGVLRLARTYAPGVPIHLSTQANTVNSESALFWADCGVTRVNLARELTCRNIHTLAKAVTGRMELEVFVHGAMCLAVSGKCLLSAWLNNRPANLGQCTHPCRFEYKALHTGGCAGHCSPQHTYEQSHPMAEEPQPFVTVAEKTRPNEALWTVDENEGYASIWSPHDLCLLPYLPWFVRQRVHTLKIEGRVKGATYVAHVVDAYKTALLAAHAAVTTGAPFVAQPFMAELAYTASRPLSTGFFVPGERKQFPATGEGALEKPIAARVLEETSPGTFALELKGTLSTTTPLEFMLPGMQRPEFQPGTFALENSKGERVAALHSGTKGVLHCPCANVPQGVFVRTGAFK
ncbi:peptidase U32 family protein [Desulfovibrio cuneatus]|uniref:peptidase U32 family protein n=1 Tax=Desulfovibrio cuneatus TaxID=159728 RepID=UPI00041E6E3D|nr:peptidase U32 family protein [Desulfovibrio cuneatus]